MMEYPRFAYHYAHTPSLQSYLKPKDPTLQLPQNYYDSTQPSATHPYPVIMSTPNVPRQGTLLLRSLGPQPTTEMSSHSSQHRSRLLPSPATPLSLTPLPNLQSEATHLSPLPRRPNHDFASSVGAEMSESHSTSSTCGARRKPIIHIYTQKLIA